MCRSPFLRLRRAYAASRIGLLNGPSPCTKSKLCPSSGAHLDSLGVGPDLRRGWAPTTASRSAGLVAAIRPRARRSSDSTERAERPCELLVPFNGLNPFRVPALPSVEKERAPVCVLTPGRSLDYFTLRVPFYTGKPQRQVWPFQKGKSKSASCRLCTGDKAEAVFIEAALVS